MRVLFTSRNALLAACILLGAALGAWGMRLYFAHTLEAWSPADRFTAQIGDELRLSPDQRRKVSLILAEQRNHMEDLRLGWRRDVRLLAREGEDRIERLLTPEQSEKFTLIHDRIHGRMDRLLWTTDAGPTAIAVSPGRP